MANLSSKAADCISEANDFVSKKENLVSKNSDLSVQVSDSSLKAANFTSNVIGFVPKTGDHIFNHTDYSSKSDDCNLMKAPLSSHETAVLSPKSTLLNQVTPSDSSSTEVLSQISYKKIIFK